MNRHHFRPALAAALAAFSLTAAGAGPARAEAAEDPVQQFRNQSTGKCLRSGIHDDRPTSEHWCGNGIHAWWVHTWRDGTVELKNHALLTCLDDSEHGLRLVGCNTSAYQSWHVLKAGDDVALRNQHTGRCLDDSAEFGVRTHVCGPEGNFHQLWR
ncbi:RICIN domain-containing protein [Saccharothrix sp. Mg75]|uniref:RICIN domain-containing protein n=1 Tax=Saccharothrix sp. Mg75 TaxID=3445357 RepID=UPI003EEACFD4